MKSRTPADVITGVLGGNGGAVAPGLAGSVGVRPGNSISARPANTIGMEGKSK